MCVEKSITKKIREGILIDAPFPTNMLLANVILSKEGFRENVDYLTVQTQVEHQYTEIKYLKSISELDENNQITGEMLKCFILIVPDRYIPKKEEQQNVKTIIKNVDDIDTLYSENKESQ